MVNKFEQLSIIRDEILTDPSVKSIIIWNAAKIAEEDKYLSDLMIDYMKSTNELAKSFFLDEICNYTEQRLKVLNEKSCK